MKPSIVVFGAYGMLGKSVCLALEQKDNLVFAIGRDESKLKQSFSECKNISCIVADICDPTLVNKLS